MTSPAASPEASTNGSAPGGAASDARGEAVQSLEASFSELMTAFRRHISTAAEQVSPGMLPGTFKVLSAVHRAGPVTLSALAERLTADKGLTSRSVSELEELGLVTRTQDPADRRSRLIDLSDLGRERLAAARAPHEGRLFAVLQSWSLHDIRQLDALIHALAVGETPQTAHETADAEASP